MEGYCNTCNKYIPTTIGNIFEIFKKLILDNNNEIKIDCRFCKTKDGIVIHDPFSSEIYGVVIMEEMFEQDSNGNTTPRSLYYQRILQCFLRGVNSYFKVREVANWVVGKVELRTKKGDLADKIPPRSDIVEDREKTFRRYFRRLVSLKLLSERQTTMGKGSGYTFEYKPTKLGHLLALLVDVEFSEDKKSAHDQLYSFLENYFDEESSSVDLFCKIYLKKCKDEGLFEIFIDHLEKNLLHYGKHIQSQNDIFTHMALIHTNDKKINKRLLKLWHSSLESLDEETQNLFIYHLKLKINEIIKQTIDDIQIYEESSFRTRMMLHMLRLNTVAYAMILVFINLLI